MCKSHSVNVNFGEHAYDPSNDTSIVIETKPHDADDCEAFIEMFTLANKNDG